MPQINNRFYDDLGDTWFEGDDHAIALLRAEGRLKLAYTHDVFAQHGLGPGARVLDVACGGGLIALPLAEAGYRVDGVDLSEGSLAQARKRVPEGAHATFQHGDATSLDAPDASVDAVLLFDMLEHVEDPAAVIAEAGRVVRPGGVVLFNTFNQTPLAWLVAVHGFRFVVREAPDHIHVWRLFLPPSDLEAMAGTAGLDVTHLTGVRPRLDGPFLRSVLRRRLDPGFAFTTTGTLAVGYMGTAVKRGA
ncbi:bifunctional 2-polyprenyl-6-hydroxyphenol methylase/3-demethylubiquinol 3-O-methyltransferase UbiG [Rubrivirga sp. IMCC45206]|uniref:bifunctional 2-polyprenyl-6-hydroxyphenol methylase/3-demethylubiquinol 3-O-methyltransferase UbiG n=1 Tax=Rubrivirga sp. IMCC45206 TaxID=3391614 RepID=UPI00399009A7